MLEILVSAMILAVGLLGALEVVARCAVATGRSQDREQALLFARSKMEEILKEPILQVGTDRGEGVDTSTDYDWEATIEQSGHPSLLTVTVSARNRRTDVVTSVSALRRPDLVTPIETTGTGAGLEGDTADDAGPGGGAGAGAGGGTL